MLSENVLVLHFNIGVWGAEKTDRVISNEVCEGKQADKKAGKFIKSLLGGKCDELTDIKNYSQLCRLQIRKLTLPYKEGAVLVPHTEFMSVLTKIRELQETFNGKVDEFIEVYPQLIEQAKAKARNILQDFEFPSEQEVRSKFTFEHWMEPLPEGNCFDKIELDEKDDLQDKLNERLNKVMEQGKRELKSRLKMRIETTIATLQNTKRQMDKRVPKNNLEMVEICGALNIMNDKDVSEIGDILKEVSDKWDALRGDILSRGNAINSLNTVLKVYYNG